MHLHLQKLFTTRVSAVVLLGASVVMSAQTVNLRAAGDRTTYDVRRTTCEGCYVVRRTSYVVRALSVAFLAPAAATTGGGLNGLYLMTRFWPGTGLELATYYFHNGSVVMNPIAGGNSLDVEAERAAHPNAVGTYRLANGQLTLTFPGSNQTAKFEDEKGCFGWDAGSFCPVEVFKPGTTLNATFTGGASAGGGGAVMASSTIAFKADGTYQRDSVATFTTRSSASTVSGGSTGQEGGRYRIDGTAMHLMPNGGKETVVTTFPYDDGTTGPAPRRVYFGGAMLSRK